MQSTVAWLVSATLAAMLLLGGIQTYSLNTGYEGQPGNQSANNGNGNNGHNGNTGYEGQPGNQSNN